MVYVALRECPKHSHQQPSTVNRLGQSIRHLEQACSEEMKRLVRTRMLGVVGGVPGNRAPIPIPWFWQFFGLKFVLVLSAAVLVIVIDLGIIRCTQLGHTIEFHRHPSQHRHSPVQHRHNPVQHRFHRGIILNLDAFGRHQYILNRGTLQGRTSCNVQKSSAIFEATFTVAFGNVKWDRLGSAKPLIASMSIKPF